jgi:hypothetical protein
MSFWGNQPPMMGPQQYVQPPSSGFSFSNILGGPKQPVNQNQLQNLLVQYGIRDPKTINDVLKAESISSGIIGALMAVGKSKDEAERISQEVVTEQLDTDVKNKGSGYYNTQYPTFGGKKRRTRRRKQRGGCNGYSSNSLAFNAAPFTGGRRSRRRKSHKKRGKRSHRR